MGRIVRWLAVAIGLLVILVVAASYFIDEPLRQRTEQKINQALRGYTVKITKLDFHPIGFSIDLEDAVIVQDAHPDPPVARIPNLTASVNWKALIFGRIVADFEIDNPKFVINLKNIRQEERDRVPIEKRGWQEALEAIYPLKINDFVISNADLTYIDQEPRRPLRLTKINFHAENIRNVRSKAGVYPSKVYLVGNVFDTGKATLDGAADFLAEPHLTFKAAITLDRIQLDYFKPIIERHHFTIKKGVLSTAGTIEYALKKKILEVPKLEIRGVEADYIHDKPEESPTAELSKKTERVIRKTSNNPTLQIHMNDVDIINGELGVVNRASNPSYRVFFSHAKVKIENLGNQSEGGVAVGRASGKFMGSGDTQITAHLRPRAKSPNFDFKLSIERTNMKTMNNLFRAYGDFDVNGGIFSFYSEMKVQNGVMDGYVKPLFKNVDIYDPRQDRGKGFFHRLYEKIIGGLSWIVTNHSRDQVATESHVSGKLSNPQTSTLDVFLGLVQNAFFKSILPGLENASKSRRSAENRG